MLFKRIDHLELVPSDTEKSLDFYINILGFKIKSRLVLNMPPVKEVIFIELGDTVMDVLSVESPAEKSKEKFRVGFRGFAIEVEDMTKAVEHLEKNNVPITVKPVDIGDSFRGEIRDPDGFMIELRQWK